MGMVRRFLSNYFDLLLLTNNITFCSELVANSDAKGGGIVSLLSVCLSVNHLLAQ